MTIILKLTFLRHGAFLRKPSFRCAEHTLGNTTEPTEYGFHSETVHGVALMYF